MTHEDYKELLAANALAALDAADARAVETHLESCAECLSEMDAWRETATALALDSRSLEPSAAVRERILASIHSENSARQSERTATASEAARILPFERSSTRTWSLNPSLAIAASLLMVAMLIGLFSLWQQNRANRDELAQLANRVRETNQQLERERAVVKLLTSPGARMMELSGTHAAPGARAMLAYDKTGHAMLMAKGLPAAPAGKAYQLWFIKDNNKMPGKVFTTDASGNGILEDQIPDVARRDAVFAITLEPESGVQSPTGAIYLVSAS